MQSRLFVVLLAAALLAACSPASSAAGDCPVTQADGGEVSAYGDPDSLQVLIYGDGVWRDLPYEDGLYSQKIWWSYPGYDWTEEESPRFVLTGVRLDGVGYFQTQGATNGQLAELGGSAILTGAEIPAAGCWRFTGIYQGDQLSFVAYVED